VDLDRAAESLRRLTGKYLPGPSRAKDLLSGTFLGHPLHPALTDAVLGCWTSALALDLRGQAEASDTMIGLGILASLPTVASGLSDYADVSGEDASRSGLVHAALNSASILLYASSLLLRKTGHRRAGLTFSSLGFGAALAAGWFGGHLAFRNGVGVDRNAFQELPADWTRAVKVEDLSFDSLDLVQVGGYSLMLRRRGGTVDALSDRCSHRGCSLHEGKLDGDLVTCPCHASVFSLIDGHVVVGPATAPQPRADVRIDQGWVEVRRPSFEADHRG
jgi:nitrite reductase/ring-hydroxylating ferredoxin subunit/uncharacterized membrane protein